MTLATVLLLVVSGAASAAQAERLPVAASPADSARAEMRVGRHWHASLILRAAGAHRAADPSLRLLLAEAEAGWGNWPEVARILGDAGAVPAGREGRAGFLLGRARERTGEWPGAAAAYADALRSLPATDPERPVAVVRRSRALLRAGRIEDGVREIAALPPPAAVAASWIALEGAEASVVGGDTAAVGALLLLVREEGARQRSWRLLPRARLAAGDTAGAYRSWLAAREGGDAARRGEASTEAGRLALALRDSATARGLLVQGLEGGTVASRARAAAALLGFSDTDLPLTLRMAGALDRAADHGPALRAYDRARRTASAAGVSFTLESRLARARLMALREARHQEALDEFRAIRGAVRDPALGARNLELWAGLRRRQGRTADVETLRGWLLEEYPSSPEAAEALWTWGRERDGAGDLDGALRIYARLAEAAPEHARAGEARMRAGQIHLGRGRLTDAARAYEAYLAAFPGGRRWEEASFWAARARLQLGDTAAARTLAARLRRDEPFAYYAVMATELLGEPYRVALPPGATTAVPAWMAEGLARLDLLASAGLALGADAEEGRLVERARGDAGLMVILGEALIRRGRTTSGINLGWEVRRGGAAWDQRLARVVFPYPFREMVERAAVERGLDPFLVAAVIRQESAFQSDIESHAGAVGLMQVMPATGRELAGRHGPSPFRDEHLKAPEVSVHLGTAFLRDMHRRYAGDLPLFLSAYNAGPARANRWREFPEVVDDARFTERIPFDETRGYVKLVRRNLTVYAFLYGP
jgi:soluble lytic murein transglycosylase